MTAPAPLTVGRAMELVAAGDAEPLEGRGLNTSYRVTEAGRALSVKVHCADRSSGTEFRRLGRVDEALRGTPWYPPVLGMGFHQAGRPRLVVIRPHVPGTASDDARRHIPEVVDVLVGLSERADGVSADEELVGDYASAWVSDAGREHALVAPLLAGEWANLARAMDDHIGELRSGATRLTSPDGLVVHHGDLHGRNLITGACRAMTVIDWDEAGFSRRPADAGKALWLSCRAGRGDFVLDPHALRRFLTHLHTRLRVPYASAADLARLGALWFLPRHGHVTLLGQRDASLGPWYLGWISRFWARFRQNLELLASTARALETDAGRDR
ncbi:phosphotransferase [Streptomyces sp. NPDC003011]